MENPRTCGNPVYKNPQREREKKRKNMTNKKNNDNIEDAREEIPFYCIDDV